ncbi:MAG: hypothetical protein ABIH66_11055 [bacterium]
MELRQDTSLRQILTITPQMLLAQKLLQMPILELRDEILTELSENPALEVEEVIVCPFCRRPMKGERCTECGKKESTTEEEELNRFLEKHTQDTEWEDVHYGGHSDDERSHFPEYISSESGFHDFLLHTFRTMESSEELRELGEYLIYCIDEDGLLKFDREHAREKFEIDDGQLDRMIEILQGMEPTGVAAGSPREALLIQLDALEKDGKTIPAGARRIVTDYLTELGKSKLEEIAGALGISVKDVDKVKDFIQRNLNPYPGRAFLQQTPPDAMFIRPSIIIKYNGKELIWEVLELSDFRLRMNTQYVDLYRRQQKGDVKLERGETDHLRDYVRRAKTFMDGISMRRQTLENIAQALCDQQRDFLIHGLPNFNDGLTQSRLAAIISVHESTVSRAMSGKYVQIPSLDVVSFNFFFDSSLRPKEYIRNIIEKEDLKKPYTDAELNRLLQEKGIRLARRTVAKYREELNFPSSFERRRINQIKHGTG